MTRADVWIVRRKGKRGSTYAVRWIDPATGRNRCKSCGRDKKLAQTLASRKREELRKGILNDPVEVSWDEFAATHVEQAKAKQSKVYADMVRCVLELLHMTCSPRSPAVVDYRMAADFVRHRLKGARRCRRRDCGFSNLVSHTKCWKCGSKLSEQIRPVTRTTLNKNVRTLRAVFADASKRYHLPTNPFDGISPLRAQEKPLRTLTLDEQLLVLDACPSAMWRTFCYLALTTGMRRHELCDLQWSTVDLEKQRIVLIRTKGKRVHVARLTEEAVGLLKRLRLSHAFPSVFVGEGGRSIYWAAGPMMEHLAETAGIPRFTCHDLRRTFGTDLARAGVNQRVVTDLIGHADIQTTARYYQAVDDEMADEAISKLPLTRSRVG